MTIFKKISNLILNLIFPPKCVFCGKILEFSEELFVCDCCRKAIPYLSESACCRSCGKPIVSFNDKMLCYHCLNETHFYYKKIVSAFEYDGDVRLSIHRYKSNPITAYANVYAKCIYKMYKKEFSDKPIDYVVTVPADKKRLLRRGTDPTDLLCSKFCELSELPYMKNALKKVKRTKKQSKLNYAERQENLKGSFRTMKKSDIKGKNFLLIDDVCTTRATIKECARELKLSGAKTVYALTLATAVKKDGDRERVNK